MPVSQTPEKPASRSATERAEEMLNRMGRGLGVFAATAGQRVQQAASTVREKPAQQSQADSKRGEKPDQAQTASVPASESGEETLERADQLVRLMEIRLSRFTSSMSRTIQKTAARVREEAEDMWAEAQHIRSQNRQKPH